MSGFTLIEVVVSLVIVSIVGAMLMVAFPKLREQQTLLLAQQKIQFLLREAQRQALHEERSEACRIQISEVTRCSDIGVQIASDGLVLFADADGNQTYTSSDVILRRDTLPATVTTPTPHSLVFLGVPPVIELYSNGVLITGDTRVPLTLQLGTRTAHLLVSAYGHVEAE